MFQTFRNVQKTMFDSKNGLLFGGATGEDKMAGLAQLLDLDWSGKTATQQQQVFLPFLNQCVTFTKSYIFQ